MVNHAKLLSEAFNALYFHKHGEGEKVIDVKTCRDINGSRVKIGDIVGQINFDRDIITPHCLVERITKEGYFITVHTDKGKIFTKLQLILMHTKK